MQDIDWEMVKMNLDKLTTESLYEILFQIQDILRERMRTLDRERFALNQRTLNRIGEIAKIAKRPHTK